MEIPFNVQSYVPFVKLVADKLKVFPKQTGPELLAVTVQPHTGLLDDKTEIVPEPTPVATPPLFVVPEALTE
jgi:hypothetical protein